MIESWRNCIPKRFGHTALDRYVVMPNHFHGLVKLGALREADPAGGDQGKHGGLPLHVGSLSESRAFLLKIVQWFKSITTAEYRRGVEEFDYPAFDQRFWQRNYYEHIVRNDAELHRIRDYIDNNVCSRANDIESHIALQNRIGL